MPLLGAGVLAIWNGINPVAESDFVHWHVKEHIPERVAVPGFLRGRRYLGHDGHPKFFNFYEAETVEVFASAPYLARLNAPSPWTRRVVAEFRDTSRTACTVAASYGQGAGGWIETVQLQSAGEAASFRAALAALLGRVAALPAIVGAHLLEGRPDQSRADTREKELRGTPDKLADWIVLIEAVSAGAVLAARDGLASNQALLGCGAAATIQRGLYSFEYGLSKDDLAAGARAG